MSSVTWAIQSSRAAAISSWSRADEVPPHHDLLAERPAAEQQQVGGVGGLEVERLARGDVGELVLGHLDAVDADGAEVDQHAVLERAGRSAGRAVCRRPG